MEDCPYLTAAQAYLADCRRRGLRPATIRYYRMVLWRLHAVTTLSTLDELTATRIRDFQDASPHLAAGSIRGFLRALKTFSAWLVDEELLPADPLSRVRLPRADRRTIAVPSDAELVELLAASTARLRIVLALLIGTGMRISDLCSLDVSDVRPSELIVRRTKNRAGRALPLDPVLEGLLNLYLADLRRAGEGPLILSRTGRRTTPSALRAALTQATHRARLTVRVGPHVLRHWHARDLAAHGASDRLLAARMGWSDHGLVARYAPVSHAELVRDVERYAPLPRLCDEGHLDGLFPRRALARPPDQRSKYARGRSAAVGVRRVARHS